LCVIVYWLKYSRKVYEEEGTVEEWEREGKKGVVKETGFMASFIKLELSLILELHLSVSCTVILFTLKSDVDFTLGCFNACLSAMASTVEYTPISLYHCRSSDICT
jgi:hypothetical protein